MKEHLLNKYGIKQVGYYVRSIEEAAQKMRNTLGAGPFVDLGVSEPAKLLFRGEPSDMRSRCALGQLAGMQIELIEVVTDGPDVYKEMGRYGLHHLCIWADDVDAVARDFAEAGYEVAMEMESGQGLRVFYFDCREDFGSYIEVNAPIEQLWQGVRKLADSDDGSLPAVIPMSALMGSR